MTYDLLLIDHRYPVSQSSFAQREEGFEIHYTIRHKLGLPKIATAYIRAVRGAGYRFVP